jgi:HK97 gp10 family phage protein
VADELAALRRGIDRLPAAVTAQLRSVAFRKSREVMSRAKALVPVDSGYTRDHIYVEDDAANQQFIVRAGTDAPRVRFSVHRMKRSGRIHTQKVTLNMLPIWLERGTVKMRARPFMRPAADAIEPSYRSEMEAAAIRTAEKELGV